VKVFLQFLTISLDIANYFAYIQINKEKQQYLFIGKDVIPISSRETLGRYSNLIVLFPLFVADGEYIKKY